MLHKTTTSKKAVEKPASEGEETHTKEGVATEHLQVMKSIMFLIHNSTTPD